MSKRNQSVGSGKHTFTQRMARAQRHITGKHGQPGPSSTGLWDSRRWRRWQRNHPPVGQTTPPRTPEYKLKKRAAFRRAIQGLSRLGLLKPVANG